MPSSYVRLLLVDVGNGTSDVMDGTETVQLGADSDTEVTEEAVADAVDTGDVQVYTSDEIVDGANELVGGVPDDGAVVAVKVDDMLDDEAVVVVVAVNVDGVLNGVDDVDVVDVDVDGLVVEVVDGV